MVKRYGGHVVNISATIADYADSNSPSVLAALTKGGLASATRSLAIEYASRGIRVNAVSPGIIQTPTLLRGKVAGRLHRPPAGRLTGGQQLAPGPFGTCLGAHRGLSISCAARSCARASMRRPSRRSHSPVQQMSTGQLPARLGAAGPPGGGHQPHTVNRG